MSFESKIEEMLKVDDTIDEVQNEDIKSEETIVLTEKVEELIPVEVLNKQETKEVIAIKEEIKEIKQALEDIDEERITEEDLIDFEEYVKLCTQREREEYEKHSISMACMRKIAKDMFLDE